jgi:hypothetical protein
MDHSYTVIDKLHFDEGLVLNAGLLDYKIETSLYYPNKVTSICVEAMDNTGSFGAKEAGE